MRPPTSADQNSNHLAPARIVRFGFASARAELLPERAVDAAELASIIAIVSRLPRSPLPSRAERGSSGAAVRAHSREARPESEVVCCRALALLCASFRRPAVRADASWAAARSAAMIFDAIFVEGPVAGVPSPLCRARPLLRQKHRPPRPLAPSLVRVRRFVPSLSRRSSTAPAAPLSVRLPSRGQGRSFCVLSTKSLIELR